MSETTWILIGLLSLPLWLPAIALLVYLLVVLCTVCVDGLIYFIQNTLRLEVNPGRLTRIALIPFSLFLFPLAMTVELVVLFVIRSLQGLGGGAQWFVQAFRNQSKILMAVLTTLWLLVPVAVWVEHGSLDLDEGGVIPSWVAILVLWVLAPFLSLTMMEAFRATWPKGREMIGAGRGDSPGIFESFVGLRYLKAKKDQSFISAITLISVAGVTLGVCALIVVLSVMSGFEEDLKSKILGTNSHIIVLKRGGEIYDAESVREKILKEEEVTGATPFIYSEAMLTNGSSVSGVVLKGIDPATVGDVTDLIPAMRTGPGGILVDDASRRRALEAIIPQKEGDLPGILLGEELAGSIRVFVGDTVNVVSPLGEVGPMGTRVPKFKKFRVVGVFHTGMYEYDSKFSYISIPQAQNFLGMARAVTGIELKVNDIYEARAVGDRLEASLGYPFWARDWMEMNKNLFSALWLEKIVMGIILTMIVMVAALNIISTLIMLVIEKGKEISILKAMGASELQIMKVFMIEGVVIGFTGTTLGSILGFILCILLREFDLIRLNPDVYYLESLPVKLSLSMFVGVAVVSMAISFVATIYPSWRASRMDPVEGLRYE